MRTTPSAVWALVLALGLCVGGVLAYDISDNTLVQPRRGNGATGAAWTDVIGNGNLFNTFGANRSGDTLSIFTNWNPGRNGSVNAAVKTADLFIDVGYDGSWDYAIVLDSARAFFGHAYGDPSTITTAQDIFSPLNGWTDGGRYGEADPKPAPTLGTSPDWATAAVTWTNGSGGLNNRADIDLSGLKDLSRPWSSSWGTATRSDDGFTGCVPIPPSVLLMGSGLLGLVLLAQRRKGEA